MVKRILVLDDNQDILAIVHETLTYENFEVKSTGESINVMPLLDSFEPDLVILDYRVAGLNGGELCHQLKINPRTSNLPVIMITGYARVLESLGSYGADHLLTKPFNLDELIAVVNSYFAGNTAVA